jgi:hypothetical protein
MLQRLLSRFSYANVMATVAVFLVLGAGGFALATVQGSGSVRFGGVKGLPVSGANVKVLAVPGVGKILAACSKGTYLRFKNTSGGPLQATAFRESDGDFEYDALADGQTLTTSAVSDPDTVRFHAFKAADGGKPAADITVGSRYDGGACVDRAVTAQAVGHG